MTKESAINAYNRAKTWEHNQSKKLRETILVPYFGGCHCRMHNCLVNYESGFSEYPVNGLSHKQLAKLAKKYDHEQRRIWAISNRLQDHFAKMF